MSSKTWRFAAAIVGLAALVGCSRGDMNPNATPNVPAPGHNPSDGGSGNSESQTSTTTGSDTTAPGAPTGTDGSSNSPNPR
ncbi:MAG: hypothetical protein BGO49_01945 [Planctomycetales bacterium 71-10]|nr:MAG: hypothetical protein BGO49_01945 [Planctomycetales bacterium 71-10]